MEKFLGDARAVDWNIYECLQSSATELNLQRFPRWLGEYANEGKIITLRKLVLYFPYEQNYEHRNKRPKFIS